jgi:hypothetical protein
MKKTHEEKELDDYARAMAANTVMWQKQAQVGQEMKAWVDAGHYDFIQKRILAPIEMECFKKVKGVRMGGSAVEKIAKIQGTLEVFDIINARIDNAIQTGQDALDHLKDLQNSTQQLKEGE